MKKLVIFGAGPIGRMLAHVFQKEYSTVFVDVNQSVIEQINHQKEFGISVLGTESTQEISVTKISAISSVETDEVNKQILDAELVLTACGMNALRFVAPVLAAALKFRLKKRNSIPLFVVACENATEQNSSYLRKLIVEFLDEQTRTILEPLLFTPDCMIDRVSILPSNEELKDDLLRVKVEKYFQLCIKEQGTAFPYLPEGVTVVNDLDAVKKQKLFTVNAVHALIAYYGFHFGYQYIHESLKDARIQSLVTGVLTEIQRALVTYGIKEESQEVFAARVLQRFSNTNLRDSVERVARDPIRKAQNSERFVSPAQLNLELGHTPSYLASGLAALYLYGNQNDLQAQEISFVIKNSGFSNAISKYSAITPANKLFELIEPPYYMGTRN